MLEQVLDFIHNYFVKEIYSGNFKIESGILGVDFLQDGQYFKIVGSVFNDGVYNSVNNLQDEDFKGQVWAMAVPKGILSIVTEIEDWVKKYGDNASKPYSSESFGGYTYTKAGADSKGNLSGTWQSVFGSRLNHWRKIN